MDSFPGDAYVVFPDAGLSDSKPPETSDVPLDAGAPPLCEGSSFALEPYAACALNATGAIPAETETSLTLLADDCFCAEAACAEARLSRGRLDFDVAVCDYDTDCGGCDPDLPTPVLRVTCRVPRVPEGRYQVFANERFIGELEARPLEVVTPARPLCSARSVEDSVCDLVEVGAIDDGAICYPTISDVGSQPEITVFAEAVFGGCDVQLMDNEIRVQLFETTCGGSELARCYPPPLPAGDYRIVVNGAPTDAALTIADIAPRPRSPFCEPIGDTLPR